jgi:antitoxin HicB
MEQRKCPKEPERRSLNNWGFDGFSLCGQQAYHPEDEAMYDYAIRFEKDTVPGLAVYCRDLPELNSFGDDEQHAVNEAVDAIETTLSIYVDQRRPIPQASAPQQGERIIHLPAVTVAKIVLWNTMIERDMRKADLCRLLGFHQTQGDRLVDFLHTSKMEQIESALAAMGKRLAVSVEAA